MPRSDEILKVLRSAVPLDEGKAKDGEAVSEEDIEAIAKEIEQNLKTSMENIDKMEKEIEALLKVIARMPSEPKKSLLTKSLNALGDTIERSQKWFAETISRLGQLMSQSRG